MVYYMKIQDVSVSNTWAPCNMIWTSWQKKCPQRSSSTRLGELQRSTSLYFYVSRNSKSLREWQVMGILGKAQQRRCLMKTVQPYRVLRCPTHPYHCLHPLFFLISRSFKPAFLFILVFQVENATWGQSIMWGLVSEKWTPHTGLKNRSENALLPWQVSGITGIMRAHMLW